MARYVTRARTSNLHKTQIGPARADSDWCEPPLLTTIEVTESDPVWTGLLDEHGNEIMRVSDPIGFRIHD